MSKRSMSDHSIRRVVRSPSIDRPWLVTTTADPMARANRTEKTKNPNSPINAASPDVGVLGTLVKLQTVMHPRANAPTRHTPIVSRRCVVLPRMIVDGSFVAVGILTWATVRPAHAGARHASVSHPSAMMSAGHHRRSS